MASAFALLCGGPALSLAGSGSNGSSGAGGGKVTCGPGVICISNNPGGSGGSGADGDANLSCKGGNGGKGRQGHVVRQL